MIGARDEPGEFQRSQWRAALEEIWRSPDKRLVPVLLGNARIPSFLANYRVLRVNSGAERHAFSKLLQAECSSFKDLPKFFSLKSLSFRITKLSTLQIVCSKALQIVERLPVLCSTIVLFPSA